MAIDFGKYTASKFFRAQDYEVGWSEEFTVAAVTEQLVGAQEKEMKIVITFLEADAEYIPNISSLRRLVEAFGEDEGLWGGKKIRLTCTVAPNGKNMLVGTPSKARVAKTAVKVQAPPPVDEEDDDEAIPF